MVAGVGEGDAVAFDVEDEGEELAHDGVVVDDEDVDAFGEVGGGRHVL